MSSRFDTVTDGWTDTVPQAYTAIAIKAVRLAVRTLLVC